MELIKSITSEHTDFIRCIQVHPTKSLILSCSDDKSIKLFDWEHDWKCIREFTGYHNRYVMNLSFINTLDQFASISLDSTIAIWDINNSSPIQTFKDDINQKSLNTVSFLNRNDNLYLITGSDDKNLKIWDLKSQSVINEIVGHEHNVTSILYNSELQLIISSSEDGSVKFWNSDNNTLVHTLIEDFQSQDAVWSLAQKNENNTSIIAIGYNDVIGISTITATTCQCSNPSYCNPISTPPRQEFLGFSEYSDNYNNYDWSVLTTIATFWSTPVTSDFICLAHSHGVRVVYGADYPIEQLGNQTHVQQWIQQQLQLVQSTNADGLNLDVESPIWQNDSLTSALYTSFVAQVSYAFHAANPNYQITVDVAWSPNCIDGRCYDYFGLAQASDFLVVMDYDLQSQIFTSKCAAAANSPYLRVAEGMVNFTQLGIPTDKLVMGLPWYGYNYECVGVTNINTVTCPIKLVPFRGVECSDAAGAEYPYTQILGWLQNSSLPKSGVQWNQDYESPWFNFLDDSGVLHQIWFDNPPSLQVKVDIAKKLNLRGVSVWTIDFLNSLQDPQSYQMWQTLGSFFDQEENSYRKSFKNNFKIK
eukprot:gene8577-10555_t